MVLALLLAALSISVGCRPSAPQTAQIPVDLKTENYFLDNGLEVILSKDDKVPVVAVNLWYNVGAADDGAGRTGYAHLVEHMMLQGSRHVTKNPFGILEAAGATNFNGNTDLDRTTYLQDVPSNQLELALWIESDRMGFLLDTLDQKQLTNQQSVVRNERRETREAAPYGLAQEELYRLLFPPGHPYREGIIGQHEDIAAVNLESMRAFLRRYYVPNNASLSIAGNFDRTQVRELIQKYFGSLPAGEQAPRPPKMKAPPRLTQERRLNLVDQVELPRVYMAWNTPAAYRPGDADATVAARMLGGGKAGRLYERLVFDRKIAQSVSASQRSLAGGSVFQIIATAKPGYTAQELEDAIQAEVDLLAKSGPSKAELEAAKTGIRAVTIKSLEQLGAVADRLNAYNLYLGDPDYINKDLQRYSEVSTSSLKGFLTQNLGRNQRAVVQVNRGVRTLAPEPPVVAATPGPSVALGNSPEPWRAAQPAAGPAPPARIPVAKRFKLENGLPVFFVRTTSLPLVTAYLTSRSGTAADPPELPGLATFTAAMLDEGTRTRDSVAIARGLGKLGATMDTGATREESWITLQSLKETFQPSLAIMAEAAQSSVFRDADVDRVRNNLIVVLQQQRDVSLEVADKVMWRELYGPTNPYSHTPLGTEEALRSISRKELKQFYGSAFSPLNAALVLVGNLSLTEAKEMSEATFGEWRGPSPSPVKSMEANPSPGRVFMVDKPGQPQTALVVGQVAVARTDPDFEKLLVVNQVLGGLFSSRLNLSLREDKGFTYGLESSLFRNRAPAPLRISSRVETRFTGESVGEILRQAKAMKDSGITQEELVLARDSLTQSLPALYQTNGSIASTVGGLFLFGLPGDYYARRAQRVAGFSLEQVNAVARRYLSPESMKIIAVGDRAAVQGQLEALGLGQVAVRSLDGLP